MKKTLLVYLSLGMVVGQISAMQFPTEIDHDGYQKSWEFVKSSWNWIKNGVNPKRTHYLSTLSSKISETTNNVYSSIPLPFFPTPNIEDESVDYSNIVELQSDRSHEFDFDTDSDFDLVQRVPAVQLFQSFFEREVSAPEIKPEPDQSTTPPVSAITKLFFPSEEENKVQPSVPLEGTPENNKNDKKDPSPDPNTPPTIPPTPTPSNTQTPPATTTTTPSSTTPPGVTQTVESTTPLWKIGAGIGGGVLALAGIYELWNWCTMSPIMRDIEHVKQLVELADKDALTIDAFDSIAAKLQHVSTEQKTEMRKQIEHRGGKTTYNPADYMTFVVINDLEGLHKKTGIFERMKYGFNRRLSQIKKVWGKVTSFYYA